MITHLLTSNLLIIELTNIVAVLLIVVVFFLVLLILGVRKSYKLKAENERLSEKSSSSEDDKDYEDFTEGHLY